MLTPERHKNIADLLMLFWYFSIKSHRGGDILPEKSRM